MPVWVDRDGAEATIYDLPPRAYVYAQLPPDDTRIALDSRDEENGIWIFEFARGVSVKLTFDPGQNRGPVWSPDGQRVAFSRQMGGSEEAYWQPADGSGSPEALTSGSEIEVFPISMTPNGSTLIYNSATPPYDVWIVPIDGSQGRGEILFGGPANESAAAVSPDGNWIACQSDESGRYEIYVRPYPDVQSGRQLVSQVGGTRPRWNRDGGELFYFVEGEPTTVMAVPVPGQPGGRFGAPEIVVQGDHEAPNLGSQVYDVSRDGQRFLMLKTWPAMRARSRRSSSSRIGMKS